MGLGLSTESREQKLYFTINDEIILCHNYGIVVIIHLPYAYGAPNHGNIASLYFRVVFFTFYIYSLQYGTADSALSYSAEIMTTIMKKYECLSFFFHYFFYKVTAFFFSPLRVIQAQNASSYLLCLECLAPI